MIAAPPIVKVMNVKYRQGKSEIISAKVTRKIVIKYR